MAVVLIDGFDHYTSAQATAKGWNAVFSSMPAGRFGGQAARFSSGVTVRTKLLPSTYSTLIAGVAFRTAALGSSVDFFQLMSGATATCRLSFNASGKLQVRNSGGTVIATGTTTFAPNVWNYFETKVFVNVGTPASGTVEVHVNGNSGSPEIASTAGNFGSTLLDTIGVLANGTNNVDFDDLYVADTTGSAPQNTFLGDSRVTTVFPNGDGAHTAWTPTGGGSHSTQLDETTPDDDVTYVADGVAGDIDTYTMGDIDGLATVYAVQTNLYARKDDANTRQIAPVIRQSATDYVGTTVTLASTYAFYSQIYNQDPTAAAWTATNVNADEFGVKEIA